MPQRIEVPGMGVVEFPDGMSDEQIAQAIQRNMGGSEKPGGVQAALGNIAAGAIRGAGSIGATLLTPMDMILGNTKSIGNPERRQKMDQALASLGFDPQSLSFGAGKLGGEIVGTAGVGSALAVPLRSVPWLAPVAEALTTGGFRAGGVAGAKGLALRTGAGGLTGAAAAGMVNPEDADIGAIVGAALPGSLQLAGAAGRKVGGAFKSPSKKAAEKLIQALESDPAVVAAKLRRGAVELVPGSKPTVAQVLRTPQSSALERVVSEVPGGALLKQQWMEQNAARLAALDALSPVDPRGLRSAQDDFGAAALKAIRGGDEAARGRTTAAYQSVPQDEAALYLPDLAAVRDEFYPRGSYGSRAGADEAVRTADEIGNILQQAMKPTTAGPTRTLAQAVRARGGVNRGGGLAGEADGLAGEAKNLVRRNGGRNLNEMSEVMYEAGLIADETPDALLEALRAEARRGGVIPTDRSMRAAYESSMGEQAAGKIPQKVTLREFDALRKSIGRDQRAAARDPARATEALALSRMKQAMDDRINEVVRGDGAIDENLPIDWANALTKAQKLKIDQVQTYRTGPQAEAFKTGSDGLPKVQGGEFARLAWSTRPGASSDIAQLKKAVGDHPEVMAQFRSMVTTEGAGTATNAGNLTGKFVRWVDNALPGLKHVFDADQVKAFQRIAQDIKRTEKAAAAGGARGSDTMQKASQAMRLGLLDNPMLNFAANRVPFVGQFSGPMLDALRQRARSGVAGELAGLLASPAKAADAIGLLSSVPPVYFPALQQGLIRSAPVLAANP